MVQLLRIITKWIFWKSTAAAAVTNNMRSNMDAIFCNASDNNRFYAAHKDSNGNLTTVPLEGVMPYSTGFKFKGINPATGVQNTGAGNEDGDWQLILVATGALSTPGTTTDFTTQYYLGGAWVTKNQINP